jgi:hypothetical protein
VVVTSVAVVPGWVVWRIAQEAPQAVKSVFAELLSARMNVQGMVWK